MTDDDKADMRALARAAMRAEEDTNVPSRIRPHVVTLAIGGGLGAPLTLLVAYTLFGIGVFSWVLVLVSIALACVGVLGLLMLLSDLARPSLLKRHTPERAVRAFLHAVSTRHWEAAWAVSSWVSKEDHTAVRPEVPGVGIERARVDVSGIDGLVEYWGPMVGTVADAGSCSLSSSVGKADSHADVVAEVPVTLTIMLDMSTVPMGRDASGLADDGVARITCAWPAYQRDGQWYVLRVTVPETATVV